MAQHLKALDARELHNMRTGSRWRRISKRHREMHPLCQWCFDAAERKIVAAEVVHHLVAHRGDRRLMYTGEIVSLCKRCHDSVAQQQEKRKRDYDTTIDSNGNPTDRSHPWWRE